MRTMGTHGGTTWRTLWFGSEAPGPGDVATVAGLLSAMLGAVFAFWIDFVPVAWLAGRGVFFGTLAWSVAGTAGLLLAKRPHRAPVRLGGVLSLVLLLFAVSWLSLTRTLPGVATMVFGAPHSEVADLRVEHAYNRYQCDFRMEGDALDGMLAPLCIPSTFRPTRDGEVFRTILHGRRGMLGFHIDRFDEVTIATP